MEDVYSATEILQDYVSGTITSLVTGLRGEGRAINMPSTLTKTCLQKQIVVGQAEIIFHAYVQYNQDDNPFLTVVNSPQTAAVFSISSGTITIKRGNGTTIGSFAAGWGIGEKHWVSFAITMANTATGKLKLWLDGTAVINSTNLQTVNAAGSTQAQGVILNGLGVWDYIGCIIGSGGWVDADVPLQKRVRAVMASAVPLIPPFPLGSDGFTTFGSGASKVARVSENPVDLTNGVEVTPGGGLVQDFFLGATPADTVFPVWGVQDFWCAKQNPPASGQAMTIRLRDVSGQTPAGGIPTGTAAMTNSFLYYHMFYATNVRAGAAWSAANYAATAEENAFG